MSLDPTTPFLGLTKPVVNDEAGEDLWGEKLNTNFDKLDASASDMAGDITVLQGSSLTDAPVDNKPYGRKNALWFDISTLPVSWDAVTGKPATFPPELPIPQSGVTGLTADQAAQDSQINSVIAALPTKEPVIAMGTAAQFWRGDKTWQPLSSITVDAYTKAQSDARFEPIITAGTTAQYRRGDKTWQTLDKNAVGLGNVDNTSDANKPVSTAQAAALAGKEPTIAAGNPAYFWRGDKTWAPVPPAGITDAPSDGTTYGRKNAAWVAVSGPVTVSLTAPVGPRAGDLWWKSDTGQLFIYYQDANSSQWVVASYSPSSTAGFVAKSGDVMTGALQVRGGAAALSPAPNVASVIASVLAADTTVSFNSYADAAGGNWPRIAAGYSGIIQLTPSTGQFTWYSGSNGAAGGNPALTQPMTLDATGNLVASSNITAKGGVIYSQALNSGANAHVYFLDETGAQKGILYWNRASNTISINHVSAGATASLASDGQFWSNGFVTNQNVSATGHLVLSASASGNVYIRPKQQTAPDLWFDINGWFNTTSGMINGTAGLNFATANSVRFLISNTGLCTLNAPVANGYTFTSFALGNYAGIIGYGNNTSYYGMNGYSPGTVYSFYGNIGAMLAAGAWATSDARFKQVHDTNPFSKDGLVATAALDVVDAIPVRHFTMLGPMSGDAAPNGDEQFGFIAQEVEAVLPVAVQDVVPPKHDMPWRAWLAGVAVPEEKSKAGEALSERDDLTFKAMNNDYLVAVLWQAVQELTARVKQLEATSGGA